MMGQYGGVGEKKVRVVDLTKADTNIVFIKHLGQQPYNLVRFSDGSDKIVCYSLNFWSVRLGSNFIRVNKSYLVNSNLVDLSNKLIELPNFTTIKFSRRALMKYKST